MDPSFDVCFAELLAKNIKHEHGRDFDGIEYINVKFPISVFFKGNVSDSISITRTDTTSEYELFLKYAKLYCA